MRRPQLSKTDIIISTSFCCHFSSLLPINQRPRNGVVMQLGREDKIRSVMESLFVACVGGLSNNYIDRHEGLREEVFEGYFLADSGDKGRCDAAGRGQPLSLCPWMESN